MKTKSRQKPRDRDKCLYVQQAVFLKAVGKYNEMARRGQQVAVVGPDDKIVIVLGSGTPSQVDQVNNERRLEKIIRDVESAGLSAEKLDASWLM